MHTERVIQAIFVAKYKGPPDGKPNALEVFNIPDSEHDSFMDWVRTTNPPMHTKLLTRGFVKLGNRKELEVIAHAYRMENTDSRVGWCQVPMQSNSVVLWRGVHRVTGAKRKKDKGCYRTVLYLRLTTDPPLEELPESVKYEVLGAEQQGKVINNSIETALCAHYLQNDDTYGWNKVTIPQEQHNKFAITPETPQDVATTQETSNSVLRELAENGFAVLVDVVAPEMASALHYTIVETVRTVLFRVPRAGMSANVRKQALQCSSRQLAKQINTPLLKKARYFKTNSNDLYCGYDVPEEESQRMKNLQGVQGMTLSSQMVDVYAVPHFAEVLCAMHSKLKEALGTPVLYFGKERCSLRSFGSAPLEAHIDEPVCAYNADD